MKLLPLANRQLVCAMPSHSMMQQKTSSSKFEPVLYGMIDETGSATDSVLSDFTRGAFGELPLGEIEVGETYVRFAQVLHMAKSQEWVESPILLGSALPNLVSFSGSSPVKAVEVIPQPIIVNWEAFRRSQLSSEAFDTLVLAASSRLAPVDPGLEPLSEISLRKFLEFWSRISNSSVEPEFALSPKGFIQTEWFEDEDHFLVLEFRSDGRVFFSLWDEASTIEGIQELDGEADLINMFRARARNPFRWAPRPET